MADFVLARKSRNIASSAVHIFLNILLGLSAVLLTTAFSLMISLRVKTVRAATHMTLFFIIPLLLLVQLGHETFLSNLFVPLVFLALSVVISVAVTFAGMKKFVSL